MKQDTHNGTNLYTYDAANRLIEVDGVVYLWDANGNLIDDGERAYTYDHSNRLIALSNQSSAYSYAYNGLGDRLQQTIDGTTTNYTLDLNRGLTQVLNDRSNAYLYGIGRIGELQGSDWQYHLGDTLGSTRQLAETSAIVNRSQSYEPFGNILSNAGEAASSYGFAGEWMDATGLMYLRARYYSPQTGRFFVKDPWQGTPSQPAAMNAYQYALNNPIMNTDPSGSIVCLCGIDPETSFCHPCSDRFSFLPPIFAQTFPESILSFINPIAILIVGALLCMPLIGELIREAPSIEDIFPDVQPKIFPKPKIDPYGGRVLPGEIPGEYEYRKSRTERAPETERLGPDIMPRVPERPRQNDIIYRRAGNTATERNVALYRGQDWLSGLSFATIPLTGAINIIYSDKKLEGAGFAVIYDGGKPDKYGVENPYWHVTVYYPIPTVWNEWYSWERTRENLGRPDNSLMDYHSMTYLLWNLRDGITP